MSGRTIKWYEDGGLIIVAERVKYDHWREERITLTRKEIAKLAKQFPAPDSPHHAAGRYSIDQVSQEP